MNKNLEKIFQHHHWRQAIDIGGGVYTPGYIRADLWDFLGLPERLNGKSFLDVGSNDGLFPIEAERRGAKMVVGSDVYREHPHGMREGWTDVGVNMVKELLHSKIEIHRNGVYHLQEIGETFDVVVVNDLINWLADIEGAMESISNVTKGTLYLGDGFLTSKEMPIKIEAKNEDLRFMYNLPYVINLLEKNNFSIEYIRRLNYQKIFVRDYLMKTEVQVEPKTPIYRFPSVEAEYAYSNATGMHHSTYVHKDFFHLSGIGWVKQNTVVSKKNEPSIYQRIIQSVGLEDLYYQYLLNKATKQSNVCGYMIKAIKK
jgi:SAM-dependent methyltransferase